MNGSFDHHTNEELIGFLAAWNRQLTRNHAEPLVEVDAVNGIPRPELEHIVAATAERLAAVARALGPLA